MARRELRRASRRREERPEPSGIVVVDSGAITRIAEGSGKALVLVRALVDRGWRLSVPAVVLVECLRGDARRDANANRFLGAVGSVPPADAAHARKGAELRCRTGNTSVVDALVASTALRLAGPVIVLTTDRADLEALVDGARHVRVVAC